MRGPWRYANFHRFKRICSKNPRKIGVYRNFLSILCGFCADFLGFCQPHGTKTSRSYCIGTIFSLYPGIVVNVLCGRFSNPILMFSMVEARMASRLALRTLMPEVPGSSPVAGSIYFVRWRFSVFESFQTPVESLPNLTQLPTEPSLLFNHGPQ